MKNIMEWKEWAIYDPVSPSDIGSSLNASDFNDTTLTYLSLDNWSWFATDWESIAPRTNQRGLGTMYLSPRLNSASLNEQTFWNEVEQRIARTKGDATHVCMTIKDRMDISNSYLALSMGAPSPQAGPSVSLGLSQWSEIPLPNFVDGILRYAGLLFARRQSDLGDESLIVIGSAGKFPFEDDHTKSRVISLFVQRGTNIIFANTDSQRDFLPSDRNYVVLSSTNLLITNSYIVGPAHGAVNLSKFASVKLNRFLFRLVSTKWEYRVQGPARIILNGSITVKGRVFSDPDIQIDQAVILGYRTISLTATDYIIIYPGGPSNWEAIHLLGGVTIIGMPQGASSTTGVLIMWGDQSGRDLVNPTSIFGDFKLTDDSSIVNIGSKSLSYLLQSAPYADSWDLPVSGFPLVQFEDSDQWPNDALVYKTERGSTFLALKFPSDLEQFNEPSPSRQGIGWRLDCSVATYNHGTLNFYIFILPSDKTASLNNLACQMPKVLWTDSLPGLSSNLLI